LADKSLASFSLTFKTADFGSITGVVMDQNGNLVSGAEVKLRSNGALVANVTTGSDGRFTINAPAGAYELTISKAGMLEKTVSATISTGQTVDLGDQTLEPDKTLAYIVIMVVIVIGAVALAVWVPRRKK
jgi:subtilase family serine protease